MPVYITEGVLEENIFETLSRKGVHFVPNDLHGCHHIKRSDRAIVKFKYRKQKFPLCINAKI